MADSPRMGWPYPDENTDPWFDAFVSMVNAMDTSVYGEREDINLIITGGGNVSFNSSTGVLAWSATINLTSAVTGFLWQLPPGSVTLANGQYAYVSLIRAPTSNVTLSMNVGSQIPSGNNGLAICILSNGVVNFRNGAILLNGQSRPIFSSTGIGEGIGSTGQVLVYPHTILTNQSVAISSLQVIGDYYFDPAVLTVTDTTSAVVFSCVAYQTNSYLVGTVNLMNLTDSTLVTSITIPTNTLSPTYFTSAPLTLPGTPKIYEIQASLANIATSDDQLNLQWAGFKVTLTFD